MPLDYARKSLFWLIGMLSMLENAHPGEHATLCLGMINGSTMADIKIGDKFVNNPPAYTNDVLVGLFFVLGWRHWVIDGYNAKPLTVAQLKQIHMGATPQEVFPEIY